MKNRLEVCAEVSANRQRVERRRCSLAVLFSQQTLFLAPQRGGRNENLVRYRVHDFPSTL